MRLTKAAEQEAFEALCGYTLGLGDAAFVHQHVVDAYAAQRADEQTKGIKITFALVGLYLLVERRRTGRQVQRVHMQLARRRRVWPRFDLPRERGSMTAVEVMTAAEGATREEAIHAWCKSVWEAFADSRQEVIQLLAEHGVV